MKGFIANSETDKVISVSVDGEGGNLFIEEGEGEYVIKNVRVEYTDNTKDGYVSKIKMDIRIKSPFWKQTPSSGNGYSMFAGGGLTFGAQAPKNAIIKISGGVYVGYETDNASDSRVAYTGTGSNKKLTNAPSLVATQLDSILLEGEGDVTINGDIYISGNSNLVILTSGNVDIRGKIYCSKNSHIIINKNTKVTCQDIIVYSNGSEKKSITASDSYGDTHSDNINWLPQPTDWSGSGTGNDRNINGVTHKEYEWAWGKYTNQYSGLYVWNGSKAEHVIGNYSTKLPNLTINSTNYPTPNTEYKLNGVSYGKFDQKFQEIMNMEYYVTYFSHSDNKRNPIDEVLNPRVSGNQLDFGTGTTLSGQAMSFQYEYAAGQKHNVVVEIGNGVQQSTNTGWIFIVGGTNQNITLNDLNSGQTAIGTCITPKKVVANAREQISIIASLAEMSQGTKLVNGEQVPYANIFLERLGRQYLDVNGSVANKYRIVNNLFNGGIATFYKTTTGSTQTGSTSVVDDVKNKSLEVVTFENWEKY